MRLTLWTMTACAAALLTGCAEAPAPVYQGPLFCDIYEPRRFSQEEIDWRAEHAAWNLRRDLTNNEDWAAVCKGAARPAPRRAGS